MRKFNYLLMMILTIVALTTFFVLPIYKFDKDKIYKNASSLPFDVTSDYNIDNYNNLSKEEKAAFKQAYKNINLLYYASLNGDTEYFYNTCKVDVLNALYLEQMHSEGPLDKNSSEETINAIEKTLKDSMGESFEPKKNEYISSKMGEYKDELLDSAETIRPFLGEGAASLSKEEIYVKYGELVVTDELFLAYMNQDSITTRYEKLNEFDKRGIYAKDIIEACKNAWAIDKTVYNKVEYEDYDFLKKVKAASSDSDWYNPWPLIGLCTLYIYMIVTLVILFFCSIKGMNGRRRPKTFVRSVVALCIGLLFIICVEFIPADYAASFHDTEYARLLDFLVFGNASLGMLGSAVCFAGIIVLSIFGGLCRFGKKRHQED